MNINDAFPSKYLKAADLQNQNVTLTIRSVELEEIDDDGVVRPIVYFNEAKRGVRLNKTNGLAIATEFGEETNDWIGRQIVLYPTTTLFKGQMVPCLRVRIDAKPQPPAVEPPKQQQPAVTAVTAVTSGNGNTGGLDL